MKSELQSELKLFKKMYYCLFNAITDCEKYETKEEILDAIEHGATTLEAIQDATYAGGGCGRCKEIISETFNNSSKGKYLKDKICKSIL